MTQQPQQPRLERPRTTRRLWVAFAVALGATVAAELLVSVPGRFGIDGGFAFHAWYGFAACVAFVLIAKGLGLVLNGGGIHCCAPFSSAVARSRESGFASASAPPRS